MRNIDIHELRYHIETRSIKRLYDDYSKMDLSQYIKLLEKYYTDVVYGEESDIYKMDLSPIIIIIMDIIGRELEVQEIFVLLSNVNDTLMDIIVEAFDLVFFMMTEKDVFVDTGETMEALSYQWYVEEVLEVDIENNTEEWVENILGSLIFEPMTFNLNKRDSKKLYVFLNKIILKSLENMNNLFGSTLYTSLLETADTQLKNNPVGTVLKEIGVMEYVSRISIDSLELYEFLNMVHTYGSLFYITLETFGFDEYEKLINTLDFMVITETLYNSAQQWDSTEYFKDTLNTRDSRLGLKYLIPYLVHNREDFIPAIEHMNSIYDDIGFTDESNEISLDIVDLLNDIYESSDYEIVDPKIIEERDLDELIDLISELVNSMVLEDKGR